MVKRGRKIQGDHKLTGMEIKRRQDDKAACIDKELDEAISKIDWKRRNAAEQSLPLWVKTYMIGLLLDDEPPEKGESVLVDMQKAVTSHNNYMICMARGQGKSCYVECTSLYALASGLQKYIVIISNNARASSGMLQDIWRAIAETDTPFSQDYPHLCKPFQLCNGSFRRRQLYRGVSTDIQKNAGNLVFARLQDENGNEVPTSGSLITVRGISGGLRGMKHGTLRPSLVLLDDLQTSEIAENPDAVEKLLNTIKKDIMPLAGKERLSILQTATPICAEDMVEKIRSDKAWKTTVYPAVISYPSNKELWDQYFHMFDAESVSDMPHTGSLEFYKANREKMDEGVELFNPKRYSVRDGHISGIQKMLELKHMIGDAAFDAEYQMTPKKYSFALDISPKDLIRRIGQNPKGVVPSGYVFVAAATDLNVSYAMTTSIVAFKRDMSATVVWHGVKKVRIDGKLNDTEYNQKVYDKLAELGQELKSLNIHIDGWGIDAGGRNWSTVCDFARNSSALCGVPACAMAGKASHMFNPFVRTRLRDAINRTVLCGDAAEQEKPGTGQKYMFFDSDFFRETVQRAFLTQLGAQGGCQLYTGTPEEHADFATQVTNEHIKLIKHRQDGKDEYYWTTREPHDYLDTMAMSFSIASSQGISGRNINTMNANIHRPRQRQKIRIV